MTFFRALTALSTSGPLASRAFLPLFIVCSLANEQVQGFILNWPVPDKLCLMLPENLLWMGNTWFVTVIGVLAVGECLADKNDDLKELMERAYVYGKTAVAFLVAAAILPEEAAIALPTKLTPSSAGIEFDWRMAIAIGSAGMTFYLAHVRQRVFATWQEFDDEDDFNLRKLVSMFEDLWALLAIPMLLILPPLAGLLVVTLLGMAFAARGLKSWLGNRNRRPCSECKAEILPHTTTCPACKADQAPTELLTWNLLFQRRVDASEVTINKDQTDRHQLRLLSARRCPACAEPVKLHAFGKEGCSNCGFTFAASGFDDWYTQYRDCVIIRALWLMLPLMLLSWIPVVGIAVAIVTIKLFLSGPLRIFLGAFPRFGLKWTMRIFTVGLLVVGSLPGLSMIAVPVLILTHILVYNRFARSAITERFTSEALTV
ncbi:hypothetical protein BVY04_00395 [bacterium M21]|nr:hypothetical protein BVY04_00395 [bacterium M21]